MFFYIGVGGNNKNKKTIETAQTFIRTVHIDDRSILHIRNNLAVVVEFKQSQLLRLFFNILETSISTCIYRII
jgi:hypothetical protein